ncbi:hypothetical protein B0H19DRAFT_1086489 [Mycena capillaripes]|nr:hypothetical protein B0H19DRAFT_1086489 [Mycena capillaripes]
MSKATSAFGPTGSARDSSRKSDLDSIHYVWIGYVGWTKYGYNNLEVDKIRAKPILRQEKRWDCAEDDPRGPEAKKAVCAIGEWTHRVQGTAVELSRAESTKGVDSAENRRRARRVNEGGYVVGGGAPHVQAWSAFKKRKRIALRVGSCRRPPDAVMQREDSVGVVPNVRRDDMNYVGSGQPTAEVADPHLRRTGMSRQHFDPYTNLWIILFGNPIASNIGVAK